MFLALVIHTYNCIAIVIGKRTNHLQSAEYYREITHVRGKSLQTLIALFLTKT